MSSPAATPLRPGRRVHRPWVLARVAADARVAWAVALVLAVALGVVSLLFAPLVVAERDRDDVREVAAAMATRVTTYSAAEAQEWASGVAALATDDYAEQVGGLLDESLRTEMAAAEVSSRGELAGVYVQSLDGAEASVFAVVRQTTRGAGRQEAVTTVRMTMTLRRTGAGWRVDGVSVLGAGGGPASPGAG